MARGTRSSHAAVEANGLDSRHMSLAGEGTDNDAVEMQVDEQESGVKRSNGQKRSKHRSASIHLSLSPVSHSSVGSQQK